MLDGFQSRSSNLLSVERSPSYMPKILMCQKSEGNTRYNWEISLNCMLLIQTETLIQTHPEATLMLGRSLSATYMQQLYNSLLCFGNLVKKEPKGNHFVFHEGNGSYLQLSERRL